MNRLLLGLLVLFSNPYSQAVASQGSFELMIGGSLAEYSVLSYPRLLDLKDLLPKGSPIDRLVWVRPSHRSRQIDDLIRCRSQIEALRESYLPVDLFATDKVSIRQSLIVLLNQMQPTGRVLEYGSLDPIDIEASEFLNRAIREGDQFILSEGPELVWTWDYQSGWRERPHRPTNAAIDYGLDAITAGSARGDWSFQISPSGAVTKIGLASFNRSSAAIPTGSLLFFPPPGFGRGDQAAFGCMASLIATQIPTSLGAKRWWDR